MNGREAQRVQTRARLYDAALAEFRRAGAADADVGAIVTAAGVARGTFYFHFPTKEHVLVELELREETRIAAALGRFLRTPRDVAATLNEVVRLVLAAERSLGSTLFKDLLGLHFRSTRPASGEWPDHPLMIAVVTALEEARERGELHPDADPVHSAMFFMLGLYALLTAVTGSRPARAAILDEYVTSTLRGLAPDRAD